MKYGIAARGRSELEKHVKGIRLTARQAGKAKCYECMGGYEDGKYTCGLPACPLFSYMPYKDIPKKGTADAV